MSTLTTLCIMGKLDWVTNCVECFWSNRHHTNNILLNLHKLHKSSIFLVHVSNVEFVRMSSVHTRCKYRICCYWQRPPFSTAVCMFPRFCCTVEVCSLVQKGYRRPPSHHHLGHLHWRSTPVCGQERLHRAV